MNLGVPSGKYDTTDQAQMRSTLQQADKRNMKIGASFPEIIMSAPNGSLWRLSVSNAGATVWTAV